MTQLLTNPAVLACYFGCLCCFVVAIMTFVVWVIWVMYDSYVRGATDVSACVPEHDIWWFIIWAYLWGIIVGCGRGIADLSVNVALSVNQSDATTVMWWKGGMLLFTFLAQLVLMTAVSIWGYTMWTTMPGSCESVYENKYPDLLFVFHLYVILFVICLFAYLALIIFLAIMVYFGVIRNLPPDHPLRAVVDPVADVVNMASYTPILSEIPGHPGRRPPPEQDAEYV
eukprot:Tamp_27313.p1 GENE.Tamp_27313~~Tamp_27313.p1  ORF type:complete len:235 (-),score=28.40 Tamp_27313:156-836(-)